MIAIYLAPLYLALSAYLLFRLIHWLRACHTVFGKKRAWVPLGALYAAVVISLVPAFLIHPSSLQRALKLLDNYWLGIMLYALMTVALVDGVRFILRRSRAPWTTNLFTRKGHRVIGFCCVALIAALSITGVWRANHLVITDYDVTIDKSSPRQADMNIILIADLHLGYNIGLPQMEKMVAAINAEKPDLVVIAGDIFDNEYEALDHPAKLAAILRQIDSRHGVYACYGNHDIQEKLLAGFTFSSNEKKNSDPRMDAFLQDANIHLLQDDSVLIDNAVYLYGRSDATNPGRGVQYRANAADITKNQSAERPIIVLDHQPNQLHALAEAGVDLTLCGHTHNGQTFPGNLIMPLLWENPYGQGEIVSDNHRMTHIVTAGVGVFGPPMRLGTQSEICSITVHFAPTSTEKAQSPS